MQQTLFILYTFDPAGVIGFNPNPDSGSGRVIVVLKMIGIADSDIGGAG